MSWKFEARSLHQSGGLAVPDRVSGKYLSRYYNNEDKTDPRTIIAMYDPNQNKCYGVMTAYSAEEADWLVDVLNAGAKTIKGRFPYDKRRGVTPK